METAYVIIGTTREFGEIKPMAGFLFGTSHPTGCQMKSLGFNAVQQVEAAKTNGDAPKEPTFYCFERTPAVSQVIISAVSVQGKKLTLGERQAKQGEPLFIIPELNSHLANKLLGSRNGLGIKDFHTPNPAKGKPALNPSFARA